MSQPRHYPHRQPFLTFGPDQTLRVRQATEQGYAVCPVGCVCDLSYPTSTLRRARVQGGVKSSPLSPPKAKRYTSGWALMTSDAAFS